MARAPRKLILASRSPRRARLLEQAGYDFEQADPPFADPAQPTADGTPPSALAAQLARQKALSLRGACFGQDVVILAADTLCVSPDGGLIGTPETEDQARQILRRFAGRPHVVVTGVALLDPAWPQARSFADAAVVMLGQLEDQAIEQYLAIGAWRGKAGGYNLTERQQAGWPLHVQGDPTTVVGLPMQQLAEHLREIGIEPGAGARADA